MDSHQNNDFGDIWTHGQGQPEEGDDMSAFLCCECQNIKDPDEGYHPCKMHPGEAFCGDCEETMSDERLEKCHGERGRTEI